MLLYNIILNLFSALPGTFPYWEGEAKQYSGPEFEAIKKKPETLKEFNSEYKAKFLLFTEVNYNDIEVIMKAIKEIYR